MNFDAAFEKLLGHEGGLSNNPADPGGLTKYGISHRAYPALDIAALTIEQAKAIYARDYWTPAGCDRVPEAIRFDLFDMAVNSGIGRAVKTLQGAAGTTQDGIIGPKTIQGINDMPSARLCARFNGSRLAFMVGLPNWPTFSRGWALRIADNLMGI